MTIELAAEMDAREQFLCAVGDLVLKGVEATGRLGALLVGASVRHCSWD